MIILKKYMPDGFQWQTNEGITKDRGKEKIRVSNAIPIVINVVDIVNHINNDNKIIVKLQYFDADGTSTLGNVQEFTVEEITTGKFMKALPIEVLTDTGSDRTLRDIFKYIIQAQIRDSKIETKEIFKDGWHKNKYHGLADKNISKEEEYKVAVKMATVLGKRNNAVAAVVLAAIHGPVKRVFQSAGIQHDFVTFVTGKTGIGKTALVKQICNYRQDTGVVFALSSERKELRKTLQNISDTTIVIDDFNISGSDRMASRQLQIISEIIQAACDSGGVILDETSLDKMDNCIHIVVTSEKLIRNLSTINRCFLVNMQESIPKDLWDEIFHMKEQNYFLTFIYSLIKYIEKDFDSIVSICKTNFNYYVKHVREKNLFEGTSANRLTETMAVQYTIKKILMDYLKTIGIDEKLWKEVDMNMNQCISDCSQELQQEINEVINEKNHIKLLPMLADIISSDGSGYEIAENEKKYLKGIRNGKPYIGFQQNHGFISFNPSYMCRMIAQRLGEESISVKCLGKELAYYQLAHVDGSEQKQSCRWHTEKKYYHVNFRQLLELIYGKYEVNDLLEHTIENFENSYWNNDF